MTYQDPELGGETIMAKLKQKTQDHHGRLESLPYFNRLIVHKLPLECYVNQLRSLSIIHGVLEHEIAAAEDPLVTQVWDDNYRKLDLLDRDLSFFQPRILPHANTPIQAALAMTEKIRLRRIENPVTLLGYLYVFEGSTLGNSMHQPDILATFNLEGNDGSRYYSSYQQHVQAHWVEFSSKMNNALTESTDHDNIIEAAHEAFDGLEDLYTTLYPLEQPTPNHHVTSINPEAGNHPVPDDKREIEAALRASDRVWAEFAYYSKRYGERGKRFSDSDICWLVTLTALDQDIVQQQIDWLCRVLASRGMPTIMMETTLRFLFEELSAAIPEKTAVYNKLIVAADNLLESRNNQIEPTVFDSLVAEFDQAIGKKMAQEYHNTGTLLVSAAADEGCGIAGSMNAISDFLMDKDRFSVDWIRTVKKTIGKAKNMLNG